MQAARRCRVKAMMYVASCSVCGGVTMVVVADEERKGLAAQAVGRAIREGMLVRTLDREALAVGMKPCLCGVDESAAEQLPLFGEEGERLVPVRLREARIVLGEAREAGEVVWVPRGIAHSLVQGGFAVEEDSEVVARVEIHAGEWVPEGGSE